VIGAKRLIYDVWGDTVNLASRLEHHSQPQSILVSELTHARLGSGYQLEPHGSIDVKGYGVVHTWLLKGRRVDGQSAPIATEERHLAPPSDALASAAARSTV
jgi:class 3 adenylate cyclase